jgi:hypothetical protein
VLHRAAPPRRDLRAALTQFTEQKAESVFGGRRGAWGPVGPLRSQMQLEAHNPHPPAARLSQQPAASSQQPGVRRASDLDPTDNGQRAGPGGARWRRRGRGRSRRFLCQLPFWALWASAQCAYIKLPCFEVPSSDLGFSSQ